MDYTNWDKERQKLKDEIFKELREQQDRKGIIAQIDRTTINPQEITSIGFQVYGPFIFRSKFVSAPHIDFGQRLADNTKPFAVVPAIHQWITTLGAVEGFYLAVYPMIMPPDGLHKHTITWRAEGKAAYYRKDSQREAWSQGYDEEKADHLHASEY